MKHKLAIASGLLGFAANAAFGVALFFLRIPQNLASWMMWTGLNGLVFFTMRAAGNKRAWLPFGYTLSSCLVTIALIRNGAWHWGMWESASVVGVIITLLVWRKIDVRYAVIMATLASSMAGIPAVRDAWLHPNPASWWLWSTCSFAALIGAIGAEKWSVKDRFYPIGSFLFNALMFILVIR